MSAKVRAKSARGEDVVRHAHSPKNGLRPGSGPVFASYRRNDLYEPEKDDDDTHIGENCHIVGEKTDAARGKSGMPMDRHNR